MTIRRSLAGILAVLLFLAANALVAQQLDQGIAKFQRGDFAGALGDLMPFAEQGSSTAQAYVAVIYANGRGVVRDNLEAATWMRLAAEQEHTLAQFNLAQMYEQGRGVRQDLAETVVGGVPVTEGLNMAYRE